MAEGGGNRAPSKSFKDALVDLSGEVESMSQIAVDTIREICEGFTTDDADYMDAKTQFRQRIGRNPTPEEKNEITLCIKRVAFSRTDELIDHLCFQHHEYMGVKTEFRKIKGRNLSDTEKANVQSKLRAIEWARLVQEKEERERAGLPADDVDPVSLTSGEIASVRKATMNLRADIDRAIAQSVTAAHRAGGGGAGHDDGDGDDDDDGADDSEDTDEGDPDTDDDFTAEEEEEEEAMLAAAAAAAAADQEQQQQAAGTGYGAEEPVPAEDPMEEARRMMAEALVDPADAGGSGGTGGGGGGSDDSDDGAPEFDAAAHEARLQAARDEEARREAAAAAARREEEALWEAEREAEIAAAEELVRQQEAARQAEREQKRKEEAAREAARLAAREQEAIAKEAERQRQAEEQKRLAQQEAERIAKINDEEERRAAEEAEAERVRKEEEARARAEAEAKEERARLAREQDAAYLLKIKAEQEDELRAAEARAAEEKAAAKKAEAEALKAAAARRQSDADAAAAAATTTADTKPELGSAPREAIAARATVTAHRIKKSVLVIQMTNKLKQASMYTPPKRDLKRHGKSDKIRLLARCFMSKNETESDILRRMRAPAMRDRGARDKAFSKLDGKLSEDQGNFVQDALKNIIVQAVVAIPDTQDGANNDAVVSDAVDSTKGVVVARNSVTESTLKNLTAVKVERTEESLVRKKSGKLDLKGVVADTTSSTKTQAQLAHLPKLHQLQRQEALARKDRLNTATKGLGDFCLETEKLAAAAMVSAGYLGNTANMEPIGAVAIAGFMGKKHRNGAWGKRCFVVKADTRELHYFKTGGKGAKRSIGDWIGCAQLDAIKLMKKKGRVLQIVFHDFYAKEHNREALVLRAKTDEIVEEWISILQATMAAGTAVNHLAEKFQNQTSAIANTISDRMASSIDNYATKMLSQGYKFANVDELISHQFSRALKILKSIMDTTQGKAVLELEAIRLKETTDIVQEDLQYAYDNLLDMLERAVVLHCHNWWVAHMGPVEAAAEAEAAAAAAAGGAPAQAEDESDDEPAPPPPPRPKSLRSP